METSLHRQIKELVARDLESTEVTLGSYRIDAIDSENRLVEVQYAGLGAIRKKVLALRDDHMLRIVKPIVVGKRIINLDPRDQSVVSVRKSPKKFHPLQIFCELLHFTQCFPHPNLTLEYWEVHTSEYRIPKSKYRFKRKRYTLVDQTLDLVVSKRELHSAFDLATILNVPIDATAFSTVMLSERLSVDRWLAQQIAYVLHHCHAANRIGKQGNSYLYQWSESVLKSTRPVRRRKKAS